MWANMLYSLLQHVILTVILTGARFIVMANGFWALCERKCLPSKENTQKMLPLLYVLSRFFLQRISFRGNCSNAPKQCMEDYLGDYRSHELLLERKVSDILPSSIVSINTSPQIYRNINFPGRWMGPNGGPLEKKRQV